mgnify:CR=1 FL=1
MPGRVGRVFGVVWRWVTTPVRALWQGVRWLFTNFPIILGVIAAGAGLASKAFQSGDMWFWIWNGAATLAIVGQAVGGKVNLATARGAKTEFKLLVFDQLAPLARQLSIMAKEPVEQRSTKLRETISSCVSCASGLAGEHVRTRATYYIRTTRNFKRKDRREVFVPDITVGRGDEPRSRFFKGDGGEGDAVWAKAEADDHTFIVDTDRAYKDGLLPGWDASRKRAYRTFITVPIRSGDRLAGLLTVNAPKPGDLTEEDVGTMRVIASLVGTAIGMAK